MDGVCTPREQIDCGAGTTLNPVTLECEPDVEPPCGTGTTLNPDTGECESNLSCAPGTIDMGGECVPDGTVICADGTMFDSTTGTCIATGDACGEGTVLLDGTCRPADEALMGEIFAGPETDDPFFDGTPQNFLPPALGESTTIEGCIDPADRDDDGELDYDADWFAFSVAAPGLYRINADGLGGMAAGFAVVARDGSLAARGWTRMGLNLVGDSSERRVYLPRAGNYLLAVFDSRSISDLNDLEDGAALGALLAGTMRAVGGGGTCYFITMEAEATPTPTPILDRRETGVLGDPEFYSVAASGRTIFSGVMLEESLGADAAFDFITGTTVSPSAALGGGQDFTTSDAVPDGEDLLIVVDAVVNISLNPVVWELDLDVLPEIVDDGTVNIINDIEPPFFNLAGLSATQGEIVHVTFTSSQPVAFVILPPSLTEAYEVCNPPCSNADFYFLAGETGAQVVQIIEPDLGAGTPIDITFTVDRQTPQQANPGTALTQGLVDERTFFTIDSSAFAWSRTEFLNQMGTVAAFNVGLHISAPGLIGAAPVGPDCALPYGCVFNGIDQSAPGVSNVLSFIDGPNLGLPLLVEITDPDGFTGDESVDINFGEEAFEDITADPAAPVTRTADATFADLPHYYLVRGFPAGNLDFQATGTSGTDPVVELLNPDASAAQTVDLTGADGTESLLRRLGANGFYAYAVRSGATAGTVDITINQEEPPYFEMRGTSSFVSVCPSNGGTGTTIATIDDGLGFGAQDEGLTANYTFTMPAGFEYFGTPASTFRVSTNGWITMDAAYAGQALFNNDPIGTPGNVDSLISFFWRDSIAEEVCVLEGSDSVTIEYFGEAVVFTAQGIVELGAVQAQVLLNADSSIEFVYGPLHEAAVVELDQVRATIGLENRDGTIGLPATTAVGPDVSILWMPGTSI